MSFLLYSAFALFIVFVIRSRFSKNRYPPGPRGLPILENILDIPRTQEYKVYAQWGKTYGAITLAGDVCSVSTFGTRLVILNSRKAAHDLLEKRSEKYSNRPSYVMAGDLVGWKDTLVLLPYAARLRSYRTMIHKLIGTKIAVKEFNEFMEREALLCARRLLSDPNDFIGPIRKAVGAIILIISHGHSIEDEHDPLVRAGDDTTDQLGVLLTPGTFLVDTFPILRFLPKWMPFHVKAGRWKRTLYELTDDSYRFAKNTVYDGKESLPNLISRFTVDRQISEEEEIDIKWAATSLYTSGADTPVSAMHSFVLAMVLYPDVQRKAQAEVDAIVGSGRLPTFSGRTHLPYTVCLMKEVIRWGVRCFPLAAPHCVTRDDVYNGYFIPKGSIVLTNIWCVQLLNDPDVYPEPHVFNPDRLLHSNGKAPQPDPYDVCFGIGRRQVDLYPSTRQ
ncbi:cytochrome P450 [Stereum hirsutum FP-91666 SS1]|uniref:Cytochrome P450 n=1 Tax=Stereum hirsutum (strain FP-91666) TaxID=721885 RepID=R7RXF4_STEHR|nr:cytochrome P450 [Stereum hirsutum FP-91666 SS1]EIM79508.1 cytochrome P450 [Stereum hirsutum FP-91666 SS1]